MKGNKIFDFSRLGFQEIINIMTNKINECVDISNDLYPRLDDYISKVDWDKIVNSDLYQKVLGDLGKTKEQLDNNIQKINENELYKYSRKSPKCLVTFMDDDCRIEVLSRLKPLSDRYNIPFSLACTTNWVGTSGFMTWEQIKTLYNTGKFEITNHTKSHKALGEITSESELIDEVVVSYNILREKGFDIETLTYPFGSTSELARDVIRRNHLNAISTFKGLNEMPINTYYMYRIAVGSYFDPQAEVSHQQILLNI